MQHLDDGTIHAWLDGALGAARAGEVELHVATCRACADRVAEARGLIAASSRILSALDHVPADVVPATERRVAAVAAAAPPVPMVAAAAGRASHDAPLAPNAAAAAAGTRRSWWGMRSARVAAVVAFVAAGTLVVTREVAHDTGTAPRASASGTLRQSDSSSTSVSRPVPVPAPAPTPAPVPAPAQPSAGANAPPPTALGEAAREARVHALAQSATAARKNLVAPESAGGAAVDASGSPGGVVHAAPAAQSATRPFETMKVAAQGKRADALETPRLVAVDTVRRGAMLIRRETYQVGSDQVVLDAMPPSGVPNDQLRSAAASAAALPAAHDSPADSSRPAIHVIQWRAPDGTAYTLSGPLSAEVLQRVRAALGKG